MSADCKQFLSLCTGPKKWKAWNNTREKYMPAERRQNLAETDSGLYYNQEEWVKTILRW